MGLVGACAAMALSLLAAPSFGQAGPPPPWPPDEGVSARLARAGGGEMHVDLATQTGAGQDLSIPKGKSAIVDLPVDARDVMVTNPQVADAVLRTPRRILVLGVAARRRPTRSSSTPPGAGSWRSTSASTRISAPSPTPSAASFPARACMWRR